MLVGVGSIDPSMLLRVAEEASKHLPVEGEWLVSPERFEPPMKAFDWGRLQFRADEVNYSIYNSFRGFVGEGVKIVAVVGGDGYVEGMNFVFGLATPELGVASVYTRRLEAGGRLEERLVKEVLHELGHLLGLGQCGDKRCVMSFSLTLGEVDVKGPGFCGECSLKLSRIVEKG